SLAELHQRQGVKPQLREVALEVGAGERDAAGLLEDLAERSLHSRSQRLAGLGRRESWRRVLSGRTLGKGQGQPAALLAVKGPPLGIGARQPQAAQGREQERAVGLPVVYFAERCYDRLLLPARRM